MAISRDQKRGTKDSRGLRLHPQTREGVSLAMLVSFAQDMFPGGSTGDIGIWPADDRELVVSVRGGGAVVTELSSQVGSGQ